MSSKNTSFRTEPSNTPLDRLSGLLERFRVHAHLSHSGPLCGQQHFSAQGGYGYLHVLRRGALDVVHSPRSGVPDVIHLERPSLLFYPRPLTHHFHHQLQDGSDFTCAQISFEGGSNNLLASALPPLIALPLAAVDGLGPALDLLFAETDRVRCGQRLLADRLFEVVLIQLLRWLLDHPHEAGIQPGLIGGLSDPRLARVLVALHDAPGEAWTLERMAQLAGMSRTAFATTFKQIVARTPADYLQTWRLALTQAGLRRGKPIKLLADELGYASASALSRAFSASLGVSPRDWLNILSLHGAKPDQLSDQ
ncbi:AraC family transcriptional regulator [Chitinibacteraceae bacterium HSL-7]